MKKLIIFFVCLVFAIPSAFADVYIDNERKYIGNDGTLHIVGEVINETDKPINQVEVNVVFYHDSHTVYQTSTEILTAIIMPEMKGTFDLTIIENIGYVDDYVLDVNFKIAQPKEQVIEITSSEFTQGPVDNVSIQGTVANNGDITANMVKVIATLYDRDGNVVVVSQTNTKPDYLRANDESFFVIPIMDKEQANAVVDYSLVAESEEYTSVPEFPLGSGLLLVASLSAYIALTKNPSVITRGLGQLSKTRSILLHLR